MSPETVESIKEALTPLMEKLGQGGEAAWAMAVRQQYVIAGRAVLLWVLLLTVGITWWSVDRRMRRWAAEGSSWDSREDGLWAIRLLFGVAFLGLGAASVVATAEAVSRLINPEWYALQSLLSLVTGQ